MKRLKLITVLLALLVAAMVMVPMVSAVEVQKNIGSMNMDQNNDPEIIAILSTAPAEEHLQMNASISNTDLSKASGNSVLENYISPSKKIINLMKTKGYTDAQITNLLTNNGYNWEPTTGASWKGTAPTAAEQKIIDQIRGPG